MLYVYMSYLSISSHNISLSCGDMLSFKNFNDFSSDSLTVVEDMLSFSAMSCIDNWYG